MSIINYRALKRITSIKPCNHLIYHLEDHWVDLLQYVLQINRDTLHDIFGPMKALSPEEYTTVFNTTGLDIDGRDAAQKDIKTDLILSVKCFAQFLKCLPGFNYIPIDDQLAIVKGQYYKYIK